MLNFKKDRVLLLKALRDLVTEAVDDASISVELDEEVAEFLTKTKDKRRLRKLKMLRREVSKYIEEVASQKKLQEAERKHNEEKRIKLQELMEQRVNDHQ